MGAALRRTADAAGAELDDLSLVRRVQLGHAQAFAELVQRYQDRIYNACWRICRHSEDARDLTQEAFLRAFSSLERFETKSGFYTWLFRIAVNVSLTHRQKTRLRYVASLDGEQGSDGTSAVARVADERAEGVAARLEACERSGQVAAALEAVEEHHRVVLVLRDVEGFDYQRIAEILGVAVGTVKSKVHRARSALAEILERRGCGSERSAPAAD